MLAAATPPIKTPLGQSELRHRTHGLGQRHRTVLLLVDGRRPLSKVLSLALQAGAETGHFEELVRLGLVEVPSEAMAPEPLETVPGALDVLRMTSVEMEVIEAAPEIADDVPVVAEPAVRSSPPTLQLADAVEPQTLARAIAPRGERQPKRPTKKRRSKVVTPPVLHSEVKLPAVSVETKHEAESEWQDTVQTPTVLEASSPRDSMEKGSETWLQHVRELLMDTLRLDAPLLSARIFVRVRTAQSERELIMVVWEIERHLSHARQSHSAMISLQRARELLGLGNTQVPYDSKLQHEDA